MSLRIVSRFDWLANKPRLQSDPIQHPITQVFDMNTFLWPRTCYTEGECREAVRQIQHKDMFGNKRHNDVRYNFMIGGDGVVYEGRGWLVQALLPVRFKSLFNTSLAIGFVGDYKNYDVIPEIMLDTYEKLIQFGIDKSYIVKDFTRNDLLMPTPSNS